MPLPLINLAPSTPRVEHDPDALALPAGFFAGLARALFLVAMAGLAGYSAYWLARAILTLVGG